MDITDKSSGILKEAEEKVRALLNEEAADGNYEAVAILAQLAQNLVNLEQSWSETLDSSNLPTRSVTDLSVEASRDNAFPNGSAVSRNTKQKSRKRKSEKDFPQFVREDNSLVKLGWSKKNNSLYEHRAPKQTVFSVSRMLQERVGNETTFSMQDILPISSFEEEEIPSYQAYLTVAWLKDMGVLERSGRSDHKLISAKLTSERLEELWERTSPRT